MAELRWIKVCLFMMLTRPFEAAAHGRIRLVLAVRAGHDVTLPCEAAMARATCDDTTWIFSDRTNAAAVSLFEHGQTGSGRLSVTENCSLVVKNVTGEDAGFYTCRQFDQSGRLEGEGSGADLSVVDMTRLEDCGTIRMFCSVLTRDSCRYSVQWLLDKDEDEDPRELSCSATVTFKAVTRHLDRLRCRVMDKSTAEAQVFTFSSQAPGDAAGSWWYVGVAAASTAVVVCTIAVVRWKRRKGEKSDADGDVDLSRNHVEPSSDAGTSRDTDDPEDGLSYASVTFTMATKRYLQVPPDDYVTYSSVNTS